MTKMGTDNWANFGIGKHFRQEDRICRKGDCGEAAVAEAEMLAGGRLASFVVFLFEIIG